MRRLRLEAGEHVRVGVHGQADLRVAEDLHHDSGAHALGEQKAGTRMPQVVKPERREAGRRQEFFKISRDVTAVERLPVPRGEHEPGFVPLGTGRQPALTQARAMRAEQRDEFRRERDCVSAPRRLQFDELAGPADRLERVSYVEHALIEVDSVRPPEPQCLALAQATTEAPPR